MSYLRYAEGQGTPAALQTLLALRDQCKAQALEISALPSFAATWDAIMLYEFAQFVSEKDRQTYLCDCFATCNDGSWQV